MESPDLQVILTSDVYTTCLQLALSTEKQELLALLIGYVEHRDGKRYVMVIALEVPERSDKRKDRVEVSSEQLLKGTEEAEKLTIRLKKKVQVIGWFHSHPHITVEPSHLDLNTQSMYQQMESSFIGMIISCYSIDKVTLVCENRVTCFQSDFEGKKQIHVPFIILPTRRNTDYVISKIAKIDNVLYEEEVKLKDSVEVIGDVDAFEEPRKLYTFYINLIHKYRGFTLPMLRSFEKLDQFMRMEIARLRVKREMLIEQCKARKL